MKNFKLQLVSLFCFFRSIKKISYCLIFINPCYFKFFSTDHSIVLAQIKIIPDTTLTRPYKQLCLHPKNRNLRHSDA